MAARLKLIYERIPWSLAFRPVFLGAAWFFAPLWLTFIFSLFFFFRSGSKPGRLFLSLIILSVLSLLPKWGQFPAPYQSQFLMIFLACYVLAWFFMFAIKEYFFVERLEVYSMLQTILFFMGTFYFFWQFNGNIISLAGCLFFLGVFLLFYEFFVFMGGYLGKDVLLHALASLFMVGELFLAITFLPLGFLNGTAFMVLIFCIYEYFWLDYFLNTLTQARILLNISVLLAGSLLVTLFSTWKI